MSSRPLSFLDLPIEVRNLIYRQVVICNENLIEPEKQNGLNCRPDISQVATFLIVSKVINTEAAPIFYANHHFSFHNVSSSTTFLLTIRKKNASHIKMLNIGQLSYTRREAQKLACCAKTAIKNTVKNLGRLCTGLEVLAFVPEFSTEPRFMVADNEPFNYWTDNAFVAVKALTIAFPWLINLGHDYSCGEKDVRMTSWRARNDSEVSSCCAQIFKEHH